MGRRRGRLPGRQLPGAVDGVERSVPRHRCATTGAGRAPSASSRPASPARPISTSATAVDRSRRSTSSPRTTVSRSPISSPTTTSTTRRTSRTTTTAPTTTAAGTAASRARPTTPRCSRCARRQQRNFLATLFLSQGVPMLLGGDEIGRTPGRQQQRVLPGQRDLLVRLGPRRRATAAPRFTRRLIELRHDHPVVRRATFFGGDPDGQGCPTSGGSVPTAGAWPAATGSVPGGPRRRVPQRRRDPVDDRPRASPSTTTR